MFNGGASWLLTWPYEAGRRQRWPQTPNPPATFWTFGRDYNAPRVESALFRTSWGGAAAPQPPRYFLGVLQGKMHPYLNPHFFHHEGDPPAAF